ncbi:DUF4276 family protein [Hymenobacter guriensis]|uniref:DUF4276 family protein n=1 Tax=Hymenobacter guriensis TaxID=2793065 RepID=A0ABS0L1K9_9BACT|nr:DUF4276 family protein [Hymenobacter guriensis]MBG8553996.1 DUF4276 family protein [Hymenobacter guriensis]
MHVEFFVEEFSAKLALDAFLHHLLPPPHSFEVFNMNSKEQLFIKLPQRLQGYATMINTGGYNDLRVVVLVDRDDDDCRDLKQQLDAIAAGNNLVTKTEAERLAGAPAPFQVLNRVVCEELESWFFGDPEAVTKAFERVGDSHFRKTDLRAPDAIVGGTAQALLRTFNKAGYFKEYANPKHKLGNRWKADAAKAIGEHLHPDRNESPSFRALVEGIRSLIA